MFNKHSLPQTFPFKGKILPLPAHNLFHAGKLLELLLQGEREGGKKKHFSTKNITSLSISMHLICHCLFHYFLSVL